MQLSDSIPIAKHVKQHLSLSNESWKILTENTIILKQQNNYLYLAINIIYLVIFRKKLKSKRYTIHQYKRSFLQSSNVHTKVTSRL